MRLSRQHLQLKSRAVRHDENGFRTLPLEETIGRIEDVLLQTGLEVQFARVNAPGGAFFNSSVRLFDPEGPAQDKHFFGKGISTTQALASAFMELIERFSSRKLADDLVIESPFNQLRGDVRDPGEFCLPAESPYRPDQPIEWAWGYSLTRQQPVLVPANLVFFPYETDTPQKSICWSDSNGLASGNCLEEAILHGILEVVERDALYIMEFNRLRMPDLHIDSFNDEPIQGLLENLEQAGIQCFFKSIGNDVAIPTIGVLLQGTQNGAPHYSYAAGTHLKPQLALSRALTEAVQLYPDCATYDAWISSGNLDHYHEAGKGRVLFSSLADFSTDDLKTNIDVCVDILKRCGAEVIVVDLSLPELPFSVVRVCATHLQPYCNIDNRRLSRRLSEVPVKLGFRGADQIQIRALCGYR
jgi:ribosomal protein S12 methylthiotransferase accessory factor